LNPLFFFTRELVNGRIPNFDAYKVTHVIDYNRKVQPSDFPVTDALYKAFKEYVASKTEWKALVPQLDRQRAFVEVQLRFDLITAAFGRIAADQVLISDDPQVSKAIEVMPRARELAMSALRARKEP
jgi:hypothetical protein